MVVMLTRLRKYILRKRIEKLEYENDLLELQLEYKKIGYAFYWYATDRINKKIYKLSKKLKNI
jgi:hypothetical protein